MQIIDIIDKPLYDNKPITLVIGKFDGIHKGHQAVLQAAKEWMDSNIESLAIWSFSDHPLWILRKKEAYRQKITSETEKLLLLKEMGVSRYYRVQFTKEYAAITAESFVAEHLSRLNVKRLVVGEGFRFGQGASAGTEQLIHLCARMHIEVMVVPHINENGEKISSSSIRNWIKAGLMEMVHSSLGRPFSTTAEVVHGKKLGRTLGFPTINLGENEDIVKPKPGVYFGTAGIYHGEKIEAYWSALISAGYRPAVNGKDYLVEAHLLNYTGDLYGKKVSVFFLRYLREEAPFGDLDSLVHQMKVDKEEAEKLMGARN